MACGLTLTSDTLLNAASKPETRLEQNHIFVDDSLSLLRKQGWLITVPRGSHFRLLAKTYQAESSTVSAQINVSD